MSMILDSTTIDDKADELSNSEIYWLYNGLDCCVTYDVFNTLDAQMDDVSRATYNTSIATLAPVMEMMLEGLPVSLSRRTEVEGIYRDRLAKLEADWQRLCVEGLGLPPDRAKRPGRSPLAVNPASPKDVQFLFHEVLGLPEKKRKKKGADFATTTTDRATLEGFRSYFHAEVFVNYILAMRDAGKAIGFLRTKLDADNRLRCSLNVAGTNTGRLSSSFSDTGSGCVRPTAQALTPTGWKALKDLNDGDWIAQWDNGKLSFVQATFYRRQYSGEMLWVNGEQMSLAVTPGHRVLYTSYHDPRLKTDSAATVAKKSRVLVPITGELEGTLEYPTYLPMLMADATKEPTQWRAAWKKDRKIKRFLKLAEEHKLEFSEQKASPGYRRFAIRADVTLPKKWGPWVLELTLDCAKSLVEEAKHWDAHIRGKSFIFYTADKAQALWFQILCHRAGYGTTWHVQTNSPEAYGNGSIIYSIAVKPRKHVQLMNKHWSTFHYEGEICCPQVPSTYWLVRENAQIMVTGNTNLQNVSGRLKDIFVAEPGWSIVDVDLEQGDSRGVAAIAWNWFVETHGEEWAGRYLDACESGDLHSAVCRMAWPNLPWGDDPSKWRPIAEQPYYRDKSYRDLAKVLGHGSNYGSLPATAATNAKLPIEAAEEFQRAYFSAFPCIVAWQERTLELLETTRTLTTPFGRRRYFWGDPKASTTRNAAIAYAPQSTTGEFINRGAINLWFMRNRHNLPIRFLLQVHDSLVLAVRTEALEELMPRILTYLRVVLPLARGREFSIPTAAKVGWNYGGFDPKENPYGLKSWKGSDDRKPPRPPRTLVSLLNTPVNRLS